MQTRRAFLDKHIPLWAAKAALRRASGAPGAGVIADSLERIVAGLRAELATMPAKDGGCDATADAASGWRSPVFNAGGRFDPFAGTFADAMLASADVCDRLGEPAAAASYRALATAAAFDPAPTIITAPPVRSPPRRRRSTWSGPNILPPEPSPFVAGEQLGFLV